MRPVVIVPVQPTWHVGSALGGLSIGPGVEPFAQGGLDEALGLAVGSRPVGSGGDVARADLRQCGLVGAAVGVGEGVVGHDPADGHAVGGEPLAGAGEEAGAGFTGLGRQQLGVGQPRAVVDGDVEVLPAKPALASGSVAGDAVAEAVDAAELLGVDVDQLAWLGALVAHDLGTLIELLEAAEAAAAQDSSDGRDRQTETPSDARATQALAPQSLDLGGDRKRGAVR